MHKLKEQYSVVRRVAVQPTAGSPFNNDFSKNQATNQTTIEQGRRLLEAGCPFVKLHMQPANHKIVPDAIPLGRLWDIAHKLGLEYEFPLELTSKELTEALVVAVESYYKEK